MGTSHAAVFHETVEVRLDSTVFCSGYERRREPADQYDAIFGTARTNSSDATVTYKMSIETGGFKSELMCVSITGIPNDYSVIQPKGDKSF